MNCPTCKADIGAVLSLYWNATAILDCGTLNDPLGLQEVALRDACKRMGASGLIKTLIEEGDKLLAPQGRWEQGGWVPGDTSDQVGTQTH